ncbi:hypothetical protein WJX77_010119 [Trebouxia sp. C0004]
MDGPEDDGKQLFHQLKAFRYMQWMGLWRLGVQQEGWEQGEVQLPLQQQDMQQLALWGSHYLFRLVLPKLAIFFRTKEYTTSPELVQLPLPELPVDVRQLLALLRLYWGEVIIQVAAGVKPFMSRCDGRFG